VVLFVVEEEAAGTNNAKRVVSANFPVSEKLAFASPQIRLARLLSADPLDSLKQLANWAPVEAN
jgi:hypothetical protein